MVEEMYLEELKEQEGMEFLDGAAAAGILDENDGQQSQNPPPEAAHLELDHKPSGYKLVRTDFEPLSPAEHHIHLHHQHGFDKVTDSYGDSMQLDFSAYNHNSVLYTSENNGHDQGPGSRSSGGGVSLTLGLQHQGSINDGVNTFFYPRDHMENCPQVEYSLLDSENQNLPRQNLMGAELLHDHLTWIMSKTKE